MAKKLAARLSQLESMRHCYGPGCARKVEELLASFVRAKFRDPQSLTRFHDVVLFLRALPHSQRVVELSERLLAEVAQQVNKLRQSGADMEEFDAEEVSGIAGTELNYTFTYEVAQWLQARYPEHINAEWDFDEQASRLSVALPRFVPLLEDDALVEADTPLDKWMSSAAGERSKLAWLLKCLAEAPLTISQKTELYDPLQVDLHWDLTGSPASRTFARRPISEVFLHQGPLIQRKEVSLADELHSAPVPLRNLAPKEAEQILDVCRDAVTVRYRELYGTTRGDPNQCYQADAGRGVQIFLWGLPPDRRLPLRAYHAGFTLKNGVPINYIEGISLFEWMEVGFNTFYTYRDGETAWVYAQVLRMLHHLNGTSCFSIDPYQIGLNNDEAIESGAFWFYRKLGFRPTRRDLMNVVEREEKKISARRGHRTAAHILRRLAEAPMLFEIAHPGASRGDWDEFRIRNLGLAVQRRAALQFK